MVDQGFPAGEWLLPGSNSQHWHLLSAPSNAVCHPEAADGRRVVCFSFPFSLLFTATRAHLSLLPRDTQCCPPRQWSGRRGPGYIRRDISEGTGRRSDWHITICTPTSLTVEIKNQLAVPADWIKNQDHEKARR